MDTLGKILVLILLFIIAFGVLWIVNYLKNRSDVRTNNRRATYRAKA